MASSETSWEGRSITFKLIAFAAGALIASIVYYFVARNLLLAFSTGSEFGRQMTFIFIPAMGSAIVAFRIGLWRGETGGLVRFVTAALCFAMPFVGFWIWMAVSRACGGACPF